MFSLLSLFYLLSELFMLTDNHDTFLFTNFLRIPNLFVQVL